MKLSILETQLKAASNMLNEFYILKSKHSIDSGYDTPELTKARSAIKSSITALKKQIDNHPDYVFDYDAVGK